MKYEDYIKDNLSTISTYLNDHILFIVLFQY